MSKEWNGFAAWMGPAGMLWMSLGIGAVAWLPRLPSCNELLWSGGAIGAIAIGMWLACRNNSLSRVTRQFNVALIAATLGFAWGSLYGYHIRSGLLSSELEQQSLLLQGRIDGLVELREGVAHYGKTEQQPTLHFQLAVDADASISSSPRPSQLPRLIQLNWYDTDKMPQSGERWQLRVKLKRPRGFANPGGFDYAAWLVANRIGATGRVERSDDNKKIATAPMWSFDALRGHAQNYLQQRLQSFPHRDLLLGLLLGDGGAIAAAEWDTFRATGTVHLFVVSGLQIAFTGGIALWFARLWWRSPWCSSCRRNYVFGALPALSLAVIYSLLAGWGVPIQRALIMFTVLMWALIARRQMRAATSWILALWLVLLFDPLAVRDIGFWFSFIAVAAILLVICGARSEPSSRLFFCKGKWLHNGWRWWRVQWALFATSLPLLLMLSGQITLLALPANLIAIPLSTFISLPLAFIALLADFFAPHASEFVWRCSDFSLDILWRYLVWLQQHGAALGNHRDWIIWHPRGIDIWICAFVASAAILQLLPRATPGRAFALIFFTPLFAPPLQQIAPGDCVVTVIDVGQGLSVLIETAQHDLLFDTGPQFGPERTVADLTVVPVLRQRGVAKLDTVVVSHNDSDHSGGWPAIAREFSVNRLLVGENIQEVTTATPLAPEFCRQGMHWRWDDIDFDMLYPTAQAAALDNFAGNNRSCVLQIDAGGARILLMGDIERGGEYILLDNPALQPAALLLAPHHGSRTSSTQPLLDRVQPRYVVFSTGYLNQFKHPHAEIVQRYRQSGAETFDTAYTGAITFIFSQGRVAQVSMQRSQLQHYWDY